ncbi:hypothetical protein GBA52_003878 [Prunus armeniaca]|nr:hypothetical protein GBA52_003878 [Prunus armeniaca]
MMAYMGPKSQNLSSNLSPDIIGHVQELFKGIPRLFIGPVDKLALVDMFGPMDKLNPTGKLVPSDMSNSINELGLVFRLVPRQVPRLSSLG